MTDIQTAPTEDAPASTPPKVDPETLALRGRPARAIRFKRSVIVSLVAIAAAGVAGTTWFALERHGLHLTSDSDDTTDAATMPTDTLSALPDSYGAIPKLGPPLPGDLGKPILERQAQLAAVPPSAPPSTKDQAAAGARQRRLAELKAARESGLLVQTSSRETASNTAPVLPPAAPGETDNGPVQKIPVDGQADPNGQQRKAEFVSAADKASDTNPYSLAPAPSPYTLSAGSMISASLITGLRSDLPGLVTAQVTEQVFDTATGHILLIPQGARLVGSYDSVVAFGQRNALVVWQRIIFPDGSSIRLDNAPATDPSGYAGLSDKVNFHTWALLKGVVLSTLLGVGSELQFTGQSDLVEAIRESTQQSVSQAGNQITSRNLNIQPTITIRPGAPVRLLVHYDLVLKPWSE